ncbi:hypothetical protein Sango_0420800 [Sesamum angolense]|uniref:Coiled-coil domain-containing protein R3HCC1L n=1 Tax=Sesamum angolense TaxID=2727404 RepID=A0AAE1XAR8_9LAMI|nr:hypothetical protein Sango_0420800 [Sesamum angolense]
MESSGGASKRNWTEAVEDLLHDGEVDQAISLLESTVSNLENELGKEELENKNGGGSSSSIADQLSTALQDLSKLYSAKGLSLRADETLSRALQVKHTKGVLPEGRLSQNEAATSANQGNDVDSPNLPQESSGEDDWEAIADRDPEELLSSQSLPGVSKLSLEDSKSQGLRRRGRGTFYYDKQGMYSDNQSDEPDIDDSESSSVADAEDQEKKNSYVYANFMLLIIRMIYFLTDFGVFPFAVMYGTHHVLVLSDFPPSTRTTDLEKLLEKFKDGFVIRWVNDTTSLAVFKTPSIACNFKQAFLQLLSSRRYDETCSLNSLLRPVTPSNGHLKFVYLMRTKLLSSIPPRDLEPPRPRPQTSVRTAQRMIAQGMGIKLPSAFGAAELRRQEEARRKRIASRQNMRDDAWGDDDDAK